MINLFINYYNEPNADRAAELKECMAKNATISNINIVQIETASGQRPTFAQLFQIASENSNEDDINIIANSDIYFDETLYLSERIKAGEVYALTRYDILKSGKAHFFNRADSQDVWIWRGQLQLPEAEFCIGIAGCDNRLAWLLNSKRYKVTNPSLSIKTYHVHNTNVRNYISGKKVERIPPPYLAIKPTAMPNFTDELKDLKPLGYSQFNEDAIIDRIFKEVGTTNKYFVDLGAGAYDGKMSNSKRLIENGWNGFGVDMKPTEKWMIKRFIEPETICEILNDMKTPKEFDLLNLDIDSSDYWVLNEILKAGYKPRLICTEFNGCLDPNVPVALEYEKGYTWDGTDKYGYSFSAGVRLFRRYNYEVIYNQHDVNLFAMPKEIAPSSIVTAKRNQYHPHNPKAKFIMV